MARYQGLISSSDLHDIIVRSEDPQHTATPHVHFEDGSDTHEGHSVQRTLSILRRGGSPMPEAQHLHAFLLHLALNHTVVPEHHAHRGKPLPLGAVPVKDGVCIVLFSCSDLLLTVLAGVCADVYITMSASSPDEEAFVFAAWHFGYKFLNRKADIVTLEIAGRVSVFDWRTLLGSATLARCRCCVALLLPHPSHSSVHPSPQTDDSGCGAPRPKDCCIHESKCCCDCCSAVAEQ